MKKTRPGLLIGSKNQLPSKKGTSHVVSVKKDVHVLCILNEGLENVFYNFALTDSLNLT